MQKIIYPKVKCARCGNCCREPVVPITHKDLARLIKSTGRAVREIVRFCPLSEMEYDPEAGLWITFGASKRAMVLRRRSGGCIFQTDQNACSVYAARPQTCRTFPYSVHFEDKGDKTVSEISLNDILNCNVIKCSKVDIDAIINDVRKENRDDKEYYKLVKRWNDLNSTGTTKDFLQFIGF